MTYPAIDTNVIIRLLTGDDIDKQQAAVRLFEEIESGASHVAAPVTVIADAVYVLSSRFIGYALPRQEIAGKLAAIVSMPGFHVQNRRETLRALSLYGATNLDFGDCFIVAMMEENNATQLYSWDRGFDRFENLERIEPQLR